jgi:2-polyprenyl-3-methyl-5-hydroxy-6-metoxy-1,4-benzoquinol methylase
MSESASKPSHVALGRVYANQGNPPLLALLGGGQTLLDVGCGAGDNAALIKKIHPDRKIYGLTHSPEEAALAGRYMERCWIADIENELPKDLQELRFDTIMFSHVLEHLRDPAAVLARFTALLKPGGEVLIAVPNVLSWRMRIQFLSGRFEYEAAGVLDETHLRFFTFKTADQYLLAQCDDLKLEFKGASGSVPLWWLRRYLLPKSWSERIDNWGCRHWPNLFGSQVLIKAVKR